LSGLIVCEAVRSKAEYLPLTSREGGRRPGCLTWSECACKVRDVRGVGWNTRERVEQLVQLLSAPLLADVLYLGDEIGRGAVASADEGYAEVNPDDVTELVEVPLSI
jgi:hypothetical protein